LELPYSSTVNSEEETAKLAADFADKISQGDVIILNGQLGAGKTFFIKQTLLKLEVDTVNSPSFAIINEYNGKIKFYHADFYRLKNIQELYDIGWQDYLKDDEAVVFIEWGNLLPLALPKKRLEIEIILNEDFSREFNFKLH
jgi:tRNA threonylcarbamoyladenosine biosynthesis protein TsaE